MRVTQLKTIVRITKCDLDSNIHTKKLIYYFSFLLSISFFLFISPKKKIIFINFSSKQRPPLPRRQGKRPLGASVERPI